MRTRNYAVATAIVMLTCLAWIAAPQAAFGQASAPSAEGVQIDGEYGPWLPVNISADGQKIDTLINAVHWFSIVILGTWSGFVAYCLIRFRQRPGHKAVYDAGWKALPIYFVIGIAVFELILEIGLSNPVLAQAKDNRPDEATATNVRVVAEQFAWNFHYAGPDGVFGKTAPQYVETAANPLGLDPGDPHGADDIASSELHVVKGRPVICELTSKDVIHSFFIPVMRIKQDVIPGMRIPVWFTATATGNYEIACAQLCGNNHYSMRALLTIHASDEDLAAWLESKKPEEFDEDELD